MVKAIPIKDADLLELIRFEAAKLKRRLPTGYDADDLESVGNEAALEALRRCDKTDPVRFRNTLRLKIRDRMKDFLDSLKVPGRANARLPADADGNELPVIDARAADPAGMALGGELVLQPGAGKMLPSPEKVAELATNLRAVMYGSIRAAHVSRAMRQLGRKAAGGDLAAIRELSRIIGPGQAGPVQAGPVQQTAVFVNAKD